MGKGSNNQTITQKQVLPPAVEKSLETAYTDFNPFGAAFDAVSEFNPRAYDGPAMAAPSDLTNAAIENATSLISRPGFLDQAETTISDIALGNVGPAFGTENAATGLLTNLANTSTTNPFLEQQINNAISGAVDKATSQYSLGGRLGSDSFGGALGAGITSAAAPILARNLQQDRANQLAAAEALGRISSDDLSRDINIGNLRLGAAESLPGLLSTDLTRLGALADFGKLAQLPEQAEIDAEKIRVADQNQLDLGRLNALLGAAGLGQGMFGTTTTQTGGGPSRLSSGLGGALTGASLANTLGITGLTPAMGGGIGALLGLLSDSRLKEDVELLGKHPNGLNVYRWKWNETARKNRFETYPTQGFIAQEAQKLYPEHVYRHPTGYLMLDYAALSNEVMGAI